MTDLLNAQPKPDYSNTLNVPKADVKNPDGLDTNPDSIPQRANLPRREPQTLELWQNADVYAQSLAQNSDVGTFILHDGPPFSNGNIHVGHAFNKILKDFTIKYRSMQGYKAPYVPGWDNNGLPIEVLVAKEFRQKGEKPTRAAIRARCREVAEQWYAVQREQFQRLGVQGDWQNPYLTMASHMAAQELEVFAELVEKGFIYRGLRPVYWSLVDETALADAEIEYADRTDPSIYVRFALRADPDCVFGPDADLASCATVIWTTTPWTIPANVAVAVGADIVYVIAAVEDKRYLVAKDRLEATMTAAGLSGYAVLKTVPGRDLQKLVFTHPLFDRASLLVLADYVTTTDGTGVVHTAPGHGKEDFATGQKYGLPTLQVLTGDGFFNDKAGPEFEGIRPLSPVLIKDGDGFKIAHNQGQEIVIERLDAVKALLARVDITHSYPHGWRSHDPLVYRATVQWFMNIDHDGHRENCLREIDKIRWFPAESKHRITAMVAGRPDWCISRQRAWGVGIPVFYAQPSGTPLLTPESVRLVRDFVKANGTDAWFDADPKDILPAGFAHPETGETEWTKETDIFDVWFDSGATCRTVLEQWPDLSYPADVYLEGGDQHRGWFNSSLMIGVATKGCAPYRQVVTNGWTLNEKGEKMSKSQMNGVAPQVVCDKYGADVLRLWVCSTDYFNDVKVGDKILDQVSVNYRTLRNTLRFALSNLYDFNPVADTVAYDTLDEIDRWALHRLNEVTRQCVQSYEVYEFHRVAQLLLTFCTTDLSSFYFDVLKDRLYAFRADSRERRAAQTVLHEVVSTLARLLAPLLSFTAEEVWQKLSLHDKPVSVLLAEMPSDRPDWYDRELERRLEPILAARDVVNKALEGTKKRLETAVTLTADAEAYAALNPYLSRLPALFLVSQVTLRLGDLAGMSAAVDGPAPGAKCARCWIAVADGGDDPAAACTGGCVRDWRLTDSEDTAARRLL